MQTVDEKAKFQLRKIWKVKSLHFLSEIWLFNVLNWFKSYRTSRSFRDKCDKDFYSEPISPCGVPRGSALGLLFVMYTTPLIGLISSLSLNHHLYSDNTQLFSSSILVSHVSPTFRPLCDKFRDWKSLNLCLKVLEVLEYDFVKKIVATRCQTLRLKCIKIHCVSKNEQNYFCYNYVKLPPNLTIFGTMMENCLKLYEVHSFSTSPNSRQCTTV